MEYCRLAGQNVNMLMDLVAGVKMVSIYKHADVNIWAKAPTTATQSPTETRHYGHDRGNQM